ncbi:hypothetical protein AAC387_Pa08g2271 [Persea americana]
MGSAQSSQDIDDGDEEEEEEENETRSSDPNASSKKLLQQAPEILPCHASASPLSPQLSSLGTPRLGPSIKVWDPFNLLSPRQIPPLDGGLEEDWTVEVFLICHGECEVGMRPDLVGGRWPAAALTGNGKRQARALAVFLKSQGVRFGAIYSSPLDRAKETAASICQELNFPEDQIQSSDALVEMSQGQWEGCLRSEIYTPDMVSFIERCQPDFSAPSGESLRQVEFRTIEFINYSVLRLPEKLRSGFLQTGSKVFSRHNSQTLVNSVQDRDGPTLSHWDLLHRHHRQGLSRKNSGKSRLQVVTTGDNKAEDEFSPREEASHRHLHEVNTHISVSSIGIFTHATPIKCLITGLLGCSPMMSHQICIDDSSTTVLQHSLRTGWQIKRLNDTAHLRLL